MKIFYYDQHIHRINIPLYKYIFSNFIWNISFSSNLHIKHDTIHNHFSTEAGTGMGVWSIKEGVD